MTYTTRYCEELKSLNGDRGEQNEHWLITKLCIVYYLSAKRREMSAAGVSLDQCKVSAERQHRDISVWFLWIPPCSVSGWGHRYTLQYQQNANIRLILCSTPGHKGMNMWTPALRQAKADPPKEPVLTQLKICQYCHTWCRVSVASHNTSLYYICLHHIWVNYDSYSLHSGVED